MPQSPQLTHETGQRDQKLVQIAQGNDGSPKVGAPSPVQTHTEKKSEEPSLGAIPDPVLLFENSLLVVAALILFAWAAKRRLQAVPHGLAQNVAEYIVEGMNNFTREIIGPGGEKYTPLIGTLFIYIFLMNLVGIIPGFHSPTGNISITLALGIVVFVYSQWEGVRTRGVVNHAKHFMGPMPMLAPLMLPVELISEFVRPFTLAIRLFGNIFGEDVIIVVLAGLGATLGGTALGWLPLQFPILFLSLLTDFVQALVFCMLACIYISLATHHEEDHGEEAHGHKPHAAAH